MRFVWIICGLAALLLPLWFQHEFFDSRWTNWIGLVTHKPVTEDFVPLLPWFGVMLVGVVLGRWLAGRQRAGRRAASAARLPLALRGLALLGRWPLSYYMLHQPVMIGALMLLAWLR